MQRITRAGLGNLGRMLARDEDRYSILSVT
jgi:hypothetical protein